MVVKNDLLTKKRPPMPSMRVNGVPLKIEDCTPTKCKSCGAEEFVTFHRILTIPMTHPAAAPGKTAINIEEYACRKCGLATGIIKG